MRKIKVILMSVFLALFIAGCSSGTSAEFFESGSQVSGKTEQSDSGMEVHFIDVGQGDATLIKAGDHAMLIDAGDNSEGTAVQSYLNSQGIEKLDYVIGTHPDADHIGGLDVVVYKFDCKKIFMPGVTSDTKTYDDVMQALKSKNQKAQAPKPGETYTLGDASFTVIAPVKGYGDETNNWSIGMVLQYGENRFLFTGDAEKEAEEDILAKGEDISADVYKASHHGSKTGSCDDFLDKVHPSYAVISCGEGNKYGHPSAQTLTNFVLIIRERLWHIAMERILHGMLLRIQPGHRESQRVLRLTGIPHRRIFLRESQGIVQKILPKHRCLML